jgi:hypothetical protein
MRIDQAREIFANVNGASFVGIDTETIPTLKGGRANPMQGRVTKRMAGASVMVFQNRNSSSYGDMVQRRLQREGKDPASFELQPRKWGTRIANTPFIEHEKDGEMNYYVEFIFLRSGEVSYHLDGVPITRDQIIGFQEREENPDSQGGLENKVVVRSFKLDSITGIRIDGNTHVIVR